MSVTAPTPKKMPKGGRKGGAVFPRITLEQATKFAKKLVARSHTGAVDKGIVYSGVVGAKGGKGNVRISALRQFGYLTGEGDKFSAAPLAKKVDSAPPEELGQLLREAVLKPKCFRGMFDTFAGDTVSRAKLRQRASDLNVHPEESDSCVENYIRSMSIAGLVSVEGDQIKHAAHNEVIGNQAINIAEIDDAEDGSQGADDPEEGAPDSESDADSALDSGGDSSGEQEPDSPRGPKTRAAVPRAIFNVNVTLDSSLDTDKLAKQLELLKKFGAI